MKKLIVIMAVLLCVGMVSAGTVDPSKGANVPVDIMAASTTMPCSVTVAYTTPRVYSDTYIHDTGVLVGPLYVYGIVITQQVGTSFVGVWIHDTNTITTGANNVNAYYRYRAFVPGRDYGGWTLGPLAEPLYFPLGVSVRNNTGVAGINTLIIYRTSL